MIFWFSNQKTSDLIATDFSPKGGTTTKWFLEVWLEAQEGQLPGQESTIYLGKSKFCWVLLCSEKDKSIQLKVVQWGSPGRTQWNKDELSCSYSFLLEASEIGPHLENKSNFCMNFRLNFIN